MKQIVAILAISMLAGCATTGTSEKKEYSQIEEAMKAKKRGDILVCHGRNRAMSTCGYMDERILRQKLQHAGILF